MKKLLAAGAVAGFVLLGAGISPASATLPEANLKICPEWDTGKIEVGDGIKEFTVHAPAGMMADQICVKAGSVKQGLGANIYYAHSSEDALRPTIEHYSGKDISHYSIKYKPIP